MAITNIMNRNGSWLHTSLWNGDTFWRPACSRMTYELQRLQQAASASTGYQNKTMAVQVKHYGATFPDETLQYALVWTYVHVLVHRMGDDMVGVFGDECRQWFGSLTADNRLVRGQNDTAVDYDSSPLLLQATAGGVKVLQASDGSQFSLWVLPVFTFAPGSASPTSG